MSKHYHLIISSLRGGGAELNCANFANWLISTGNEVSIIVLNLNNSRLDKILNSSIKLHDLKVKNSRNSVLAIGQFLKSNKVSKILCFNHQLSIVIYLSKILFRLKTRVILRNPSNLYVKHKNAKSIWHGKITNSILKVLLKKNNYIIAQCEEMRNMLIKHYHIDKDKASFVYNGISNRFNDVTPNVARENEILYVGRLVEMKRVDHIICAFNEIVRRNVVAHLKLVGEGQDKNRLLKLVRNLGIEEKVSFFNYSDNIVDHFKSAKMTVLASEYEGFPNVLVESLACGTPLVSYDISTGVNEIIDNCNGMIAENGNIQDLALALEKTYSKEWNYTAIKSSAQEKFDINYTFSHYKSIIDKC